jgi:iron only hydrogenase large subunit-like protein
MYGISERKAGFLIEQFLSGSQGLRIGGQHRSGFQWVIDTNRLREACLVLGAEEVATTLAEKSRPKPILTSACPGWICYAEKTHPHILPHLSALKSPQALSGTLLKSVLSRRLGVPPSQIWHLAIMPCFDKKLEASREELTNKWWQKDHSLLSESAIRDVDCVITSRELLSLANARGINLTGLPLAPLSPAESIPFPDKRISKFLFQQYYNTQIPDAGSSGGYLYHVLRSQQSLHPSSTISIQRGRNADVVEYTLNSPEKGSQILKCARYYGFRNIQNLVRKLKPLNQSRLPGAARRAATAGSGTEYAYVEVMACPGGCTNGGGQIKAEDILEKAEKSTPQSQREWLRRVDEAYYSADSDADIDSSSEMETDGSDTYMTNSSDEDEQHAAEHEELINGINVKSVKTFLADWASLVDVPLETLAYTTFRKVESDVGKKKNVSDTERIAAIAGMSGGGW